MKLFLTRPQSLRVGYSLDSTKTQLELLALPRHRPVEQRCEVWLHLRKECFPSGKAGRRLGKHLELKEHGTTLQSLIWTLVAFPGLSLAHNRRSGVLRILWTQLSRAILRSQYFQKSMTFWIVDLAQQSVRQVDRCTWHLYVYLTLLIFSLD